jgi:Tol biopolymer transport system component
MSSEGGTKRRLTSSRNILYQPQDPAWSPDSREIAYIRFLSLVVIDRDGTEVQELPLAGLSNVSSPQFHPLDSDLIIFKARRAQDLFEGFNLYVVSRSANACAVLRESSLTEMFHEISPDGQSIAFSAPLQ